MVQKTLLRLSIGLGICLGACTTDTSREVLNNVDAEPIDTNIDRTQQDTARGVQLLLSRSGHLYTSIHTQLMVRRMVNDKPSELDMYGGVNIYSIDPSRDTSSTVYAKKGYYDEQSKYIILRDSVRIRTSKDEQIETDYLTWADSSHEFHTESDIKIITAKQEIRGKGMTAAEDFSYYTIHKIKGIIHVDDAEF